MQSTYRSSSTPARLPDDVKFGDALSSSAGMLNGAMEALRYRAEAEDDAMLFLIADVVSDQVDALRAAWAEHLDR